MMIAAGIGQNSNPESLFNFLKVNTIYKNDPNGIELIQSAGTLFENNYHGIRGAGDCDCFTVLCLGCLSVLNYKTGILLFKNGQQFTHITAALIDDQERPIAFDLTANNYAELRKYKKIEFLEMTI